MKSIKFKLVLVFMSIVFIAMIVSATFIVFKYRSDEAKAEEVNLRNFTRMIEEQVLSNYDENRLQDGFNSVFASMISSSDIEGAVLSADGFVVHATTNYIANLSVPTVISSINGLESFEAWREDVDSSDIVRKWFEFSKPVFDETGEVEYIIYSRCDATDSANALSTMVRTLSIALIIAMILTAIMSVILSKTVTDPIIDLKNKAELLAKGELDQKAITYGDDEIGRLGESFNYMAKELKRVLVTISYEKNKVEIVLNNMQDGAIAFDYKNSLIHANPSALEMLDTFLITYDDVVRVFRYNNIDITKNPEEITNKTIEYCGRYLKANVSKFGTDVDTYGTMIMLEDVTKSRKLDEIRKDFVANVSHEIRTPLTTIKTYAETLKMGAIEDKEVSDSFLNIIESEADRMTVLADDLLLLTRLDKGKIDLNFEEVDLYVILKNCILQTNILALSGEQKVYISDGGNAIVEGDVSRLNQVFNNILTNAIKYNRPHGEVYINVYDEKTYYRVEISDTGIGILKKDLDRIFERFYRVDKARSRSMGGTGLGLAISRQIIQAHGGNIYATSEINVGTKMIVCLNKYSNNNNQTYKQMSLLDEMREV